MDFSVVFFVFAADFANERHHHSETPTDQSHHNLSIHRIIQLVRVLAELHKRQQLHPSQ
jgi:hypothetical protein